jgi:hypothetical protein
MTDPLAQPAESAPVEALDMQQMLDTEETRDFARALVRVWRSRVKLGQPCYSLVDLAACMNQQRADEIERALSCRPEVNVGDLAAALRYAARLALKTACGCRQTEVRSLCVRLATRCEADASKLRGQLLWQSTTTAEPLQNDHAAAPGLAR